jgi:prepilin-type N-terminal cleavage/methylation domain-containing protein
MRSISARPGITLVELIVALAIMAITAGIAGVAYSRAERVTALDEVEARLGAARQAAIRDRRAVTVTLTIDGHVQDLTAFPDGSVVIDGPGDWDLLAGGTGDAK